MAEESLLPNGDDAGWASGGFADVDELVSSPDDGNFVQTAVNGKGEQPCPEAGVVNGVALLGYLPG